VRNKWTESFLLESEDLLAEIEECALALSQGDPSGDIIGRLFRAFHTIKGTGAMCGLDQVAEFTHHIETLLDDIREHRVGLQPDLAELILASVDQIKSLLSAAEQSESSQNQAADQDLVNRIRKATASQIKADAAAGELQPKAQVLQATASMRDWKIQFRPDPGMFACGGNPMVLFRELSALGEINVQAHTDAVPALDALQPTVCYLSWTIQLRTISDENEIRDVFLFVEDGAELSIEQASALQSADRQAVSAQSLAHVSSIAESARNASQRKQPQPGSAANTGAASARESVVRVPASRLDRLVNLVGELVMNQSRLAQATNTAGISELVNPVQEMDRLVAELRDDVLGIRMLPIGTIFGRFQRLVHDLSKELGKQIALVTEGAETELDKSILDQLSEPLIHLIRNSVDHGIEAVEERASKGKPITGTIRLSAFHRGSDVVIRIEDDGQGIDCAAVREKAIDRNLISADAHLSEKELFNLILLPGFSTAKQVTNISGRGVGMDVVRKQIDALHGSLSIASEQAKGTTLSISLPLTLAIIDGLIVDLGGDQFIIPMAAVTENVELGRVQRTRQNGRNVIPVRGELVPYIDLRAAFRVEGNSPQIEKVVIVRHGEDRVGLVVDRVLGTHQTVLQSLGRFFRKINVVSGSTILGDGRVALILDIAAIVQYVESGRAEFSSESLGQKLALAG
jgi:two-component system, chemotaxis family, sensor kinase CheA